MYNVHSAVATVSTSRWALVATGLWIRAGTAGAFAMAGGLATLFGDNARPALSAFAITAGAVLAALAWRRVHDILDRADTVPIA